MKVNDCFWASSSHKVSDPLLAKAWLWISTALHALGAEPVEAQSMR
jgi:hypothetical protein